MSYFHDALSAWSTLGGTVVTTGALIVALVQAAKARRDLRIQLQHQNWLEQRRIEGDYLSRMFEVIAEPYDHAGDFFFSAKRLLGLLPTHIAPSPEQERELRAMFDRFAEKGKRYETTVGNYVDILGANRELEKHGRSPDAQQYDSMIADIRKASGAVSDLREWLADPQVIRAIDPGGFFDLPQVAAARDATYAASRNIARRIVRLYENPPAA